MTSPEVCKNLVASKLDSSHCKNVIHQNSSSEKNVEDTSRVLQNDTVLFVQYVPTGTLLKTSES